MKSNRRKVRRGRTVGRSWMMPGQSDLAVLADFTRVQAGTFTVSLAYVQSITDIIHTLSFSCRSSKTNYQMRSKRNSTTLILRELS